MSLGIMGLVLFAAVLHSSWNAIAKAIPSRLASSTLIALVYLVVGIVGVFVFDLPSAQAWPFIAISAVIQTAYLILLTTYYKYGDFSQVYPLARGLAVLVIAIVATLFLGERLDGLQLIGVAIVGTALLCLAMVGKGTSKLGVLFAVLTGLSIASYSLIDGVGVRQSGSAMGYVSWLFLLQGLMIPVVCWFMVADRKVFVSEVRSSWKLGALGGTLSMLAYGIAVLQLG